MSNITLTIPNDDTIALRQFGKALIEIASEKEGHPVDVTVTPLVISTETLQQAAPQMMGEPEVDTTAQQIESLSDEQIADDLLVAASELLNVPPHVLTGQEVPPTTTDSTGTPWDERIHSTSKALNADGTWRLRRKPKDMDEGEWAAFVETVKAELSEGLETPAEAYLTGDFVKPPVTHQNPVYMYQESRNVYALGRSEEEIAEYETKGYVRHTQEQYDAWEGPTVADEGDDFHTDAGVVTEQTVAGIPPLPVPQLGGSGSRSIQSTHYKLVGSGDDLSSGSGTGIPPLPVPPPVPEVTEWDFPHLMTFLTERHGKIDVATVNMLLAQDGISSVQELNAHPDKIGPFVARVKAHLGE